MSKNLVKFIFGTRKYKIRQKVTEIYKYTSQKKHKLKLANSIITGVRKQWNAHQNKLKICCWNSAYTGQLFNVTCRHIACFIKSIFFSGTCGSVSSLLTEKSQPNRLSSVILPANLLRLFAHVINSNGSTPFQNNSYICVVFGNSFEQDRPMLQS